MKTKPTTTLNQYFHEIQTQIELGSTATFTLESKHFPATFAQKAITLWEMQYGQKLTRQSTPLECFQNFHKEIMEHTKTMTELHKTKLDTQKKL